MRPGLFKENLLCMENTIYYMQDTLLSAGGMWRQADIGLIFKRAYNLIGDVYRVMVFNYIQNSK